MYFLKIPKIFRYHSSLASRCVCVIWGTEGKPVGKHKTKYNLHIKYKQNYKANKKQTDKINLVWQMITFKDSKSCLHHKNELILWTKYVFLPFVWVFPSILLEKLHLEWSLEMIYFQSFNSSPLLTRMTQTSQVSKQCAFAWVQLTSCFIRMIIIQTCAVFVPATLCCF